MQPKNKKSVWLDKLSETFSRVDNLSLKTSSFSMDMPDMKHITVRGCKKIAYYSPNAVSLCTCGGCVNIFGEGLLCVAFTTFAVGVEGKIKCVFFSKTPPMGGR